MGLTPLVSTVLDNKPECMTVLLKYGAYIESTDPHQNTALTLACGEDRVRCLKILVARGANIETREYEGWTGLMQASRHKHGTVCIFLSKGHARMCEPTREVPR